MRKIIIDNMRRVSLDYLIFLILVGPEASEGYLYFRNIAKNKAKKILSNKDGA